MNLETHASTAPGRWIDALLRVLDPGQEICMEAELLKHFPFARTDETVASPHPMRMPTTVHGAL